MKNLFLIAATFLFFKLGVACDVKILNDNADNSVNTWLGNQSKFSMSFKVGKCALDGALGDLTYSERKVIANLIAKSYKDSEKKQRDIETYNY